MAEKRAFPPEGAPPAELHPQATYPPGGQPQMQPGPAGTQATGYPAPVAMYPAQNVVYPGQQILQPGTSTVIIQTAPQPPAPPMTEGYARTFRALGGVQIAMGCACFLFNVIGLASHLPAFFVGAGIWAGGFFILTGAFGVMSGKKKKKGYVIAFLVLSILMPCLFVVAVLTQASAGLADRVPCHWKNQYNDDGTWDDGYYHCDYSKESETIAWNTLLIIAGVVELVSSIVSSAYCCGFLCCRNYQTGQVQYIAGQQLIVAGQPMQQGQPLMMAGQPLQQQGQPLMMAGQPLQQQGQPLLVTGPPMAQQGQQAYIPPQYSTAPQNKQQPGGLSASGVTPDAPPAYTEMPNKL